MDSAGAEPQTEEPAPLLNDVLTEELVHTVLGFLEAPALARAAATCTLWARIAREDSLWRPLCHRDFRCKQYAHAFAAALAPSAAAAAAAGGGSGEQQQRHVYRNAYGRILADSLCGSLDTLVRTDSWFRSTCNSVDSLGFGDHDTPTVCNLHWRMRFTRVAGGGPESRACRFKPDPPDADGTVPHDSGMLELAGYPDLTWQFQQIDLEDGGSDVVMMIHNFPPHEVFRRAHRPGPTSITDEELPGMPPRQEPHRSAGNWGWVIRNSNVTFWTYDPALIERATAQKDLGNDHYRSGAHAAARQAYGECLELLSANLLGASHEEWRAALLAHVRALAERDMHTFAEETMVGDAKDPVAFLERVAPSEAGSFWTGFRWSRVLGVNRPGETVHPRTFREECDAYIELLTDEERILHATALANYAMAAIATLRDAGMSELIWRHAQDQHVANFDTDPDSHESATPVAPCIYVKLLLSGAAEPMTLALAVDCSSPDAPRMGKHTTIGQVKTLIADAEGIAVLPQGVPVEHQRVYFGGVWLDDDDRTLHDYNIQIDETGGTYGERGRSGFLRTKLLQVVDTRQPTALDSLGVAASSSAEQFLDESSPMAKLAQDAWLACVQVMEMYKLLGDECTLPLALHKKVCENPLPSHHSV
jgi:hypothetical protein